MKRLRDFFVPIAIFLLALNIRFVCLLKFMRQDYVFEKYTTLAHNIVKMGWIGKNVFGDNPLYIYFHAIIQTLFGQYAFSTAIIIQFIIGSLSCVLTYYIARKVFDNKVAITASIIHAFYGMMIVYDGSFIPVTLIIFFNSLAILFLLKFEEDRKIRNAFMAGVALGLSANTQPYVLIFVLFYLSLKIIGPSKNKLKESLSGCLLLPATVMLLLLPVTIRNYVVGKDLVPVTASAGIIFYVSNNPQASGALAAPPQEILPILDKELRGDIMTSDITVENNSYRDIAMLQSGRKLKPSEVSNYWFRKSFQFIIREPLAYLRLQLRKLFFSINAYEVSDASDAYINYMALNKLPFFNFGIIFPLGVLGFIVSIRFRKKLMLLYGMLVLYYASLLIFCATSRYRMPAVPFLIIFCAYGISYLWEHIKLKRLKPLFFLVIFLLTLSAVSFHENDLIKDFKKHQYAFNIYFLQAASDYRKGDRQKARELFNKAVELYPSLATRVERIMENK